ACRLDVGRGQRQVGRRSRPDLELAALDLVDELGGKHVDGPLPISFDSTGGKSVRMDCSSGGRERTRSALAGPSAPDARPPMPVASVGTTIGGNAFAPVGASWALGMGHGLAGEWPASVAALELRRRQTAVPLCTWSRCC